MSLPQETFLSSGASVKASLLFLQKFTAREQVDFDKKHAAARKEIEAKHAPEIETETARLNEAIEAAKSSGDAEQRKKFQRELAAFENRMAEIIAAETRALLKERFPYPIFLYEAERVGITATGEDDLNELCRFPKDNVPPGVEKTCFELYTEFLKNPKGFFLAEAAK